MIDKNSGREFSAFLARTQWGNDVPSRKVFTETAGYSISQIPASELERWRKATSEIDDAWVADMNKRGLNGKAMLQDALGLIKQYTK